MTVLRSSTIPVSMRPWVTGPIDTPGGGLSDDGRPGANTAPAAPGGLKIFAGALIAPTIFVPEEGFDTAQVVRPRTSPLLETVQTDAGERSVGVPSAPTRLILISAIPPWWRNSPKSFASCWMRGCAFFALMWRSFGNSRAPCINLPQTHELIRLFRTLIECAQADAIVITETNVPNTENLSYFGNANEAHAIYNFSLPPLLVHSLLTGTSKYLRDWMMRMPPAQDGTTYFNFIASHDGIGLPVEGLLDGAWTNSLPH